MIAYSSRPSTQLSAHQRLIVGLNISACVRKYFALIVDDRGGILRDGYDLVFVTTVAYAPQCYGISILQKKLT